MPDCRSQDFQSFDRSARQPVPRTFQPVASHCGTGEELALLESFPASLASLFDSHLPLSPSGTPCNREEGLGASPEWSAKIGPCSHGNIARTSRPSLSASAS